MIHRDPPPVKKKKNRDDEKKESWHNEDRVPGVVKKEEVSKIRSAWLRICPFSLAGDGKSSRSSLAAVGASHRYQRRLQRTSSRNKEQIGQNTRENKKNNRTTKRGKY